MAYEKQTWVTGDTITAEKLNHMEDGIASASGGTDVFVSVSGYLGQHPTVEMSGLSFDELWAMLQQHNFPIIIGEPVTSGSTTYYKITEISFGEYTSPTEYNSIVASFYYGDAKISIELRSDYTGIMVFNMSGQTVTHNYTWTYDATTKEYTWTEAE